MFKLNTNKDLVSSYFFDSNEFLWHNKIGPMHFKMMHEMVKLFLLWENEQRNVTLVC